MTPMEPEGGLDMNTYRRQYHCIGGGYHGQLPKWMELRFLLILIVVSQLCINSVEVSAEDPNTPNVARTYRFFARCSQKQVQVRGRKVNANAKRSNNYTLLEVESVQGKKGNDSYYVRLKSVKYKYYICFNKRGGLRVMHAGHHDRCKFTEILTQDQFTEFKVATPEGWFIGFRKNGHPINGADPRGTRHKSKCYQFNKIPVNQGSSSSSRHGPLRGLEQKQVDHFYSKFRSWGTGRRTRRTHRPDQT